MAGDRHSISASYGMSHLLQSDPNDERIVAREVQWMFCCWQQKKEKAGNCRQWIE